MFREELHKELDRLSPSPELLDQVSRIMREEAEKKRPKASRLALRYAAAAAAICLTAFTAAKLAGLGGIASEIANEAGDASDCAGMETYPETAAAASAEPSPEEWEYHADTVAAAEDRELPEAFMLNPAALEPAAHDSVNGADGAEAEPADENPGSAGESASEEFDGKSASEGFDETALTEAAEEIVPPEYPREAVTEYADLWPCDRAVLTFEEAAEKIRTNEALSLCRLKISGALTEEEAALQPQFTFANGCTYYRAETEDLLTGEKEEQIVIFAGTAEKQESGNPFYQAGDEILCETEERDGVRIIREYPLFDLYETDSGTLACLRIFAMELPEAENLFPQPFSIVTTTGNNPANYYGIYRYEEAAGSFQKEIQSE